MLCLLLLQLLLGLVPLPLSLTFWRMSSCVLRAPSRSALRSDLTSRRRATSMPIRRGRTPVSSDPFGISASGMTPSESGIGRLTVVKQMLYSCI